MRRKFLAALSLMLLATLACEALDEPLPTLAPTTAPKIVAPPTPVSTAATARPTSTPNLDKLFNQNLLINGDAESDSGNGVCKLGDKGTLKGWQVEAISLATYGSASNEPTATSLGPANRGVCYFRLSVFGNTTPNPQYSLAQHVDVSAAQNLIDAGKVKFVLSGFLSSITHEGTSSVRATFKNSADKALTVASTPFVNSDDKIKFNLLETKVEGVLPSGTRRIEVRLQFQSNECETCESALFADNLSFTLSR